MNTEQGIMYLAGLSNGRDRKANLKAKDSATKNILQEDFGLETDDEKARKKRFNNRKKKIYKKFQVDKFPVLKDLVNNDKLKLSEKPSEEELLVSALGALEDKYPIGKSPLSNEYDTQNKNIFPFS